MRIKFVVFCLCVFVDDDWISSVLDSSRVPRVVLGLAGSELADQIRNEPLVAPQSELEGLNSEAHAFRNVRLQNELLSEARARGLFAATWDCRFDSNGEDEGWVVALAALDDAYCTECRAPTIVKSSHWSFAQNAWRWRRSRTASSRR